MHESEMAKRTKIAIDEAVAGGFVETAIALRLLLESCEADNQSFVVGQGRRATNCDNLRVEQDLLTVR